MTLHISYPAELPVSERREDLMAAIAANQVTIIAGETGSGKTTQIPKMCLELGLGENGLIGHTQPRRLAARTVAERIAEELGVEIGQEVGFQVRFTGEVSRSTKVKLMTDGILLAEIQRDKLLRRYNAIIIDEAHERSLNIDFILGYLKRILPQRPDLKIIITSATIDPERFAKHFGSEDEPSPIIEVSGRTYPVEIRYRPLSQPAGGAGADDDGEGAAADDELEEDRDPLDAVCDAVDELALEAPGDILIFFSGEREIRDAAEALNARIQSNRRLAGTEVLPLFARLSLQEQHKVFHPGSKRRIVLATNVAETSLTVPGIKYVIDTGTARISRYSHRTKVQRLPIERVSQASANQRSGRCGRVSDGIAIRLYSEEDFESRPLFTDPEILRTNLAAVILQMTAMGVARGPKDVENFPFVEPPDSRAINDGVSLLRELGALSAARQEPTDDGDGRTGRRPAGAASGRNGVGRNGGGLTAVGQKLAQLPVDPRLGRMIVEAGKRGCVREVMILAAALTIQDPRERPTDKQQLAAEKHARFRDENSDFTGYLNLWNYLQEKQQELSSTAFRRLCRNEFINYLRVREWQDLFAQLRQMARPLGISLDNKRLADPVGNHDGIHISLLSGLLSHIGILDERKREYAGARGSRFAIFPGSALFKKSPTFVMAAELVETSRLWARVAAKFDPLWAEQVAPDLIKRSYSEPHWSKKMGSVMAHEKVTLYGVPIIPSRRVNYGNVDPELCRELFIRHALVEGDWQTHHKFFHRNRALLHEVEELEARMRRRDILVDDETLFEFYDARIGKEVVSERHFDKWWKDARQQDPTLLDFDQSLLISEDAAALDDSAYPKTLLHKGFELPLSYEFHPVAPGSPPNPSDGVTAEVPVLFLNQLDDAAFRWLIPGQRVELVTALIKSLPKQVRKNFVPAPDVARQAVAALEADFDPATDELEPSLELVLRRIRGQVIPPGSWNWDAVPPHLRVSFKVVDSRGKVLDEGKDLGALQERLAPATRRAIAESLGATPATTAPSSQGNSTAKGKAGANATSTANGKGTARTSRCRHVAVGRPGGCIIRGPGRVRRIVRAYGLDLRNRPAPGPGQRRRAHRHRLPGPGGRGKVRGTAAVSDALRTAGGHARRRHPAPGPQGAAAGPLRPGAPEQHRETDVQPEPARLRDRADRGLRPGRHRQTHAGRAALGRGILQGALRDRPGGADRHRLHGHRRRGAHPGEHTPDRKAAQRHHEPGPHQRAQRRQEPTRAARVSRFRGTHGLRPAQPAAPLPRGDRKTPREAAGQRPAGRPAHGCGPGPRGRLRRRRLRPVARTAGRCGVNPRALDDRRAEGEPLRRRTRDRLFGVRKAHPGGA